MKKYLFLAVILAALLLFAACAAQPAPPPADTQPATAEPATEEPATEEVAIEEPAAAAEEEGLNFADISTKDIYGNEVDGSIFTDYELTMLNIWATYCGPCIMEMPYLGEMAAEMPEGTQLVGLAADAINEEYLELAIDIAEETGANFLHLLPDKILYTYVYQAVVGVPTTIFIDSEGNVVGEQLVGARPRLVYETELAERLELVRNGDLPQ